MEIENFIAHHRVARLATVSAKGQPHVVPIVYAYDGDYVYIALDEKPKRVSPRQLKRVQNIEANSRVSLVIDKYDEDWQKLAWVRIDGRAKILYRGKKHTRAIALLRGKYPQYRQMRLEDRPVIRVRIRAKTFWEASHG